jgi:Xaa-Pro aminopeptidase
MVSETQRIAALAQTQQKAAALFERIGQSLIRPGISETQLAHEIAELGRRQFGIEQNWHKRIVRAGPNTLQPYDENPPDLTIGADDILFIDLGPVFEAWEADFGRTFVLGADPHKLKLRDDVAAAFVAGKRYFQEHPQITGSELYAYTQALAAQAGWEFGGSIAAHLIGEFPHKSLPVERAFAYADAANHSVMRGLDGLGRQRHWILEIHFVDRARRIGGFYEELLTVG